jgi:hypothetical protein
MYFLSAKSHEIRGPINGRSRKIITYQKVLFVCKEKLTSWKEATCLSKQCAPTIVLIPPPMNFIKEREKIKDNNDDSLVPSFIYR